MAAPRFVCAAWCTNALLSVASAKMLRRKGPISATHHDLQARRTEVLEQPMRHQAPQCLPGLARVVLGGEPVLNGGHSTGEARQPRLLLGSGK